MSWESEAIYTSSIFVDNPIQIGRIIGSLIPRAVFDEDTETIDISNWFAGDLRRNITLSECYFHKDYFETVFERIDLEKLSDPLKLLKFHQIYMEEEFFGDDIYDGAFCDRADVTIIDEYHLIYLISKFSKSSNITIYNYHQESNMGGFIFDISAVRFDIIRHKFDILSPSNNNKSGSYAFLPENIDVNDISTVLNTFQSDSFALKDDAQRILAKNMTLMSENDGVFGSNIFDLDDEGRNITFQNGYRNGQRWKDAWVGCLASPFGDPIVWPPKQFFCEDQSSFGKLLDFPFKSFYENIPNPKESYSMRMGIECDIDGFGKFLGLGIGFLKKDGFYHSEVTIPSRSTAGRKDLEPEIVQGKWVSVNIKVPESQETQDILDFILAFGQKK